MRPVASRQNQSHLNQNQSLISRQHGHNRTSACKTFSDMIVVSEPQPHLQKQLQTDANEYSPPCWQLGMCRSESFYEKLAPLHLQMFAEIRRQLTSLFGTTSKEVLQSGDCLIKISWRIDSPSSWKKSSSSGSRAPTLSSACKEEGNEGFKLFLIVSWRGMAGLFLSHS